VFSYSVCRYFWPFLPLLLLRALYTPAFKVLLSREYLYCDEALAYVIIGMIVRSLNV